MRAVVTGATGLVGRNLLSRVDQAVALSRGSAAARAKLGAAADAVFAWDPLCEPAPPDAFDSADAVFHLAGETVAEGRWNAAKKARIRDSRVVGTRNLVATLRQLERPPRVLVSASAVGYYGDRGDEFLDETAAPGSDFLAQVCADWEREALAAGEAGIRVVTVRIGIVLSSRGGALAKMLTPFRLGLGSPLGSGRQWMSWIHLDDLIGLLLLAAERQDLQGAINATAPAPGLRLMIQQATKKEIQVSSSIGTASRQLRRGEAAMLARRPWHRTIHLPQPPPAALRADRIGADRGLRVRECAPVLP